MFPTLLPPPGRPRTRRSLFPKAWRGGLPLRFESLEDRAIPAGHTIATATPVAAASGGNPTRVLDSIDTRAEIDLFAVTVGAGETLRANITARGLTPPSTLDSYLRVFDAAGTALAFNDDANGSLDSALAVPISAAGTYYVGVSSFGNSGYNPVTGVGSDGSTTGGYELAVSRTARSTTPGGTTDTALPVALGAVGASATRSGVIGADTPLVLYRVTTGADGALTVAVTARGLTPPSGLDSYLRVFDAAGEEVDFNDDSNGSLDSSVRVNVAAGETYFVGVSSFGNSGYDPAAGAVAGGSTAGPFDIRFDLTQTHGTNVDNAPVIAVPLVGGATDPRQLLVIRDRVGPQDFFGGGDDPVAVYAVELAAGEVLTTTLDPADPDAGLVLRAFSNDPYQAYEVAATDTGDPSAPLAQVRVRATVSGTYYIGVSAGVDRFYDPLDGFTHDEFDPDIILPFQVTDRADFTLVLSRGLATPAADDTFGTAVDLDRAPGAEQKVYGRVTDNRDYHLYEIVLQPGDRLDATALAGANGSPLKPLVRVFDADGFPVDVTAGAVDADRAGDGANGNPSLTFVATDGGTFYLGVSAFYEGRDFDGRPNADFLLDYDPTAVPDPFGFFDLTQINSPTNSFGFYRLSYLVTPAAPAGVPVLTPGADTPGAVAAGAVATYAVTVAEAGRFTLAADGTGGFRPRVTLTGAAGNVIVASDGPAGGPGGRVDQHLTPGVYTVAVAAGPGGAAAGSFTLRPEFSPASAPGAGVPIPGGLDKAVVGDFDGDGRRDVVVVGSINSPESGLTLLRGLGDGTFAPGVDLLDFLNGGVTFDVVAGDFLGHGNGQVDLAVVDNRVTILSMTGGTVAAFVVDTQATSFATQITAGHFDADGRLDLFVTEQAPDSRGTVLTNLGGGAFADAAVIEFGDEPLDTLAADFDGDGLADVATVDAVAPDGSITVTVARTTAGGGFAPGESFTITPPVPPAPPPPDTLGFAPPRLVAGQFGGAGGADLAVVFNGRAAAGSPSSATYVAVYAGDGAGGFSAAGGPARVGPASADVAAADLDGDGLSDLVTADTTVFVLDDGDDTLDFRRTTNEVSVLLGQARADGTFGFGPAAQYGALVFPVGVAVGDFDADGRPDLAVVDAVDTAGSVAAAADAVAVLRGVGGGRFDDGVANRVGVTPAAGGAADFNRDGLADAAVVNYDTNDVSVLLSNGDGTFREQTRVGGVGTAPSGLAVDDFNGDGRPDLAVSSLGDGTVTILLGLGDGRFLRYQPDPTDPRSGLLFTGPAPYSITSGDFDGNGRKDLAVAGSDGLTLYAGTGAGAFTRLPSVAVPPGAGLPPVPVGYLTADASTFPADRFLDFPIHNYAAALTALDLDGDGRTDRLALAAPEAGKVILFAPDGAGRFAMAQAVAVGIAPQAVVAFSPTPGGPQTLLAVANQGDATVTILSAAGGTFAVTQTLFLAGTQPQGLAAADLNGDGRTDLAVASLSTETGGYATVLLGNSDGTFRPDDVRTEVVSEQFLSGVIAADFTGDGAADLAGLDFHFNTLTPLDGAAADGFTNRFDAAPAVADLDGDGVDDVVTVRANGEVQFRRGLTGGGPRFDAPLRVATAGPVREVAIVRTSGGGTFLATLPRGGGAVTLYSLAAAPGGATATAVTTLTAGTNPSALLATDLDGNGTTDLVVTDPGTRSVFVYRGQVGSGGRRGGFRFADAVVLRTGDAPTAVAAADIDGANGLDLVVADQISGQVSVYLSDGAGGLGAPTPHRGGTATAGLDNRITGPGDAPTVRSADRPAAVVAAGPAVVVVAAGAERLTVLTRDGGGLADPVPAADPTGRDPGAAVAVDFDGSPRTPADVGVAVVNSGDGTVTVFTPTGAAFARSDTVQLVAGFNPVGIAARDVTGDAATDLILTNTAGDVVVLVGNGDGTFRPYRETAAASIDILRGTTTALVTSQSRNQVSAGTVSLTGTTDLAGAAQRDTAGSGVNPLAPGTAVYAALVDGRPAIPVVLSGGTNSVIVYGGGAVGAGRADFFTGTNPVALAVADLNGDGVADMAVANAGSADVAVLFGGINFGTSPGPEDDTWFVRAPGPRLRLPDGVVPNAIVVMGGNLVVTGRDGSVTVLRAVGGGFFDDARLTPDIPGVVGPMTVAPPASTPRIDAPILAGPAGMLVTPNGSGGVVVRNMAAPAVAIPVLGGAPINAVDSFNSSVVGGAGLVVGGVNALGQGTVSLLASGLGGYGVFNDQVLAVPGGVPRDVRVGDTRTDGGRTVLDVFVTTGDLDTVVLQFVLAGGQLGAPNDPNPNGPNTDGQNPNGQNTNGQNPIGQNPIGQDPNGPNPGSGPGPGNGSNDPAPPGSPFDPPGSTQNASNPPGADDSSPGDTSTFSPAAREALAISDVELVTPQGGGDEELVAGPGQEFADSLLTLLGQVGVDEPEEGDGTTLPEDLEQFLNGIDDALRRLELLPPKAEAPTPETVSEIDPAVIPVEVLPAGEVPARADAPRPATAVSAVAGSAVAVAAEPPAVEPSTVEVVGGPAVAMGVPDVAVADAGGADVPTAAGPAGHWRVERWLLAAWAVVSAGALLRSWTPRVQALRPRPLRSVLDRPLAGGPREWADRW